jgi:hypothetical protein
VHDFKRNGLVSGIKDIGEYWKICKGVVLYSQKLWEVLNGTLDQEDNKWEKCQSAAYMTKLNIRYTTKDELTTPGKGFVERILKHKRIQIIKNILFRSKNTHGRTLTINRKSKNGEIENKKNSENNTEFKKRSEGLFDPATHIRDKFDEFISAEVKEKELNMTYDDMIRSRGKLHPVNKQTNMM